ncbi:hypothetical protein PIROE2DRAFT_9091 [Piromyces sp. E2]|nr:hypothetical protein PIROE2DRAFT_9091 [Piromyces sp. E2]|eukprot:OUM64189.1 hypothetical protein PIROE2DRAFT_9091 [Piromyces sp. E2]
MKVLKEYSRENLEKEKHDESLRLCVDYHCLNAIIISHEYLTVFGTPLRHF